MPGFHRSLRAARRAVGCGERGRRARGRADGAAGGRQLLSGRLRARRVRDSQIRRTIDGQIRRVAGDQVRRVALVVVRVLLRHRLPPLPCSSQKSPLCQAWPVLLAQSLVSGYCN